MNAVTLPFLKKKSIEYLPSSYMMSVSMPESLFSPELPYAAMTSSSVLSIPIPFVVFTL